MAKIHALIELDYDAEIMHSGDRDVEAKGWFFDCILGDELILHSNEIGDEIGKVRVLKITPAPSESE